MAALLVDCDPALGLPFCDVDDALALYLLVRGGIELAGVTTVFGNTSVGRTHRVAEELCGRWGLPVHRGASGPGDIDTTAVAALVAHPGDVLAIGPMTNVAAALDRGARWSRLVLLGGTTARGPNVRGLRTTELNFALDLPSARRALNDATVLFPMEVCRQVLFGSEDFSVLPGWIADRCRHWLSLGPAMTGHRGVHPWDVLPAMWMLHPELFTGARRGVRLRSGWSERGHLDYEAGGIEVIEAVDGEGLAKAWRRLCGDA